MSAAARLTPVLVADEVWALWLTHFPQVTKDGAFTIVSIRRGEAVLRLEPAERHLRPGGTVSGPTLFTLADVGAYAVLLAHVGAKPLIVTTGLTINFMRKPPLAPILGECRILKLGQRLAVVEVDIRPEAGGDLLAHAVGTYSIPTSAVDKR